ncbi:MAG: hypothetical protein DMG35_21340 [Acidobacteria bacterium]|nr:MAG: hypothetical protein DMG35_21340 [Acidobacteriota bacterium]
MNQPHRPNHQARANPEREVQEKRTLQTLALELPLPGEQTGDQHRNGGKRGNQEIAVRGRSQQAPVGPKRQKIERHTSNKQRYRKMDQHDVLGMFREQRRLQVERIQHFVALIAR